MRRALYEYIIGGIKNNMPFHKAVMENPRFVAGALGTHFIENEINLLADMKAIIEREKPSGERLSHVLEEKRRIAAIAAAAAVAGMYHRGV
jgi:pyruvate carboxylase subunit A